MDQKPFHLKSLFLIIGLIVIAALVAVILSQQQQIKSLRGQQNQNTNTLKASDQLQAPVSGERQLISMPYPEIKDSSVKTNTDTPNSTEKFSDSSLHFEISLPFNDKWGTDQYKINPFELDKSQNTLYFGPIVSNCEGDCSLVRQYSIKIDPPKTAVDVMAELKKNSSSEYTIAPQAITYEGFTVIKYSSEGQCPSFPVMIVIGKKHNYTFQTNCGPQDSKPVFDMFNDIIKTLNSI